MRQQPTHHGNIAGSRLAGQVVMLMACLWAAAGFASPGVSLTMKAAAVIDGDAVHLSDIADLGGGEPNLLKTMGDMVVGSAPNPGQTRFVGIDYVRLRLRQAGYDPDVITIGGPGDVRISRQSADLPVGRIRADVASAIRSRMPWKSEQVTISDIDFDETMLLPTGELTYRIVFNRNEDFLGSTIVGLHLFVDGEPLRRLWVNATITVMADVVTVVRPLGKHQHIELEDLSVATRDLAGLPADTVRRIEDALGNRATRMIYPGTVLQASMVDAPPLVKRGDIVKIVADAGAMTITATGMVKEQGRLGEMIRVMNTESKRVILARVTGPGAVQVDF